MVSGGVDRLGPSWQRAPVVRIVDHGASTTIVGARGVARRFDDGSGALVRAVLELCASPCDRAALIAGLTAMSDNPVSAAAVDDVIALLVEEGVLVLAPAIVTAAPARPAGRRVLLAVSGAVAAADAPATVRGLQALGCQVRVAMTQSARQFVSARTLAAITHHPVWSSLWQGDATTPAPHMTLAEWSELVVVCPASATTLARLAHGDAACLVAATVLATRAPVIVVPSMNAAMYDAPATQANLAALRDHGRGVVHPATGLEGAHQPDQRRWVRGAAPPLSALLDVIRYVLIATAPAAVAPIDAAGWERVWSGNRLAALPWHSEQLEPELVAALVDAESVAGPRRLLDVGCGAGTVAIAAATRGWTVTASDVAATALQIARSRAGDAPILFALDDATRSQLSGPFEVVVDRGTWHALPPGSWPAYAATLTRWIAPGGRLILVTHAPEVVDAGTTPVDPNLMHRHLPGFEVRTSTSTTISGCPALLMVICRS